MKSILFAIISVSLALSPVAIAGDVEGAVPINEGEPAPFTGTLLTNEAAATILSEINTCTARATAAATFELEKSQSICSLEKSLLQINLDSQKEMYENIVFSQDAQLDYMLKTKNPAVSKEVAFIIGVVAGVGLTVASAYTISIALNSNQ